MAKIPRGFSEVGNYPTRKHAQKICTDMRKESNIWGWKGSGDKKPICKVVPRKIKLFDKKVLTYTVVARFPKR